MNARTADWHIGSICLEVKLGARHISNYANDMYEVYR